MALPSCIRDIAFANPKGRGQSYKALNSLSSQRSCPIRGTIERGASDDMAVFLYYCLESEK